MTYVGEIISNHEAERRGLAYDSIGGTYLFDMDKFVDQQELVARNCPTDRDETMRDYLDSRLNRLIPINIDKQWQYY